MKFSGIVACSLLFGLTLSLPAQTNAQSSEQHGVVLGNIDHAVKPGDNFFLYANGEWVKRTEIPADRTSVGGFAIVADRTDKRVAGIIEGAEKAGAAPGSEQRLIADLYHSYMDTDAIETAGTMPLKGTLDEIAGIKTREDLARALGGTLRADTDALNATNFHTANLFGLWVAASFNDPDHYTAYLMQGGVVLPNREYYVSDNAHMKEIRAKYQAHMARTLRLAGFDEAEGRAARVFELETAIAQVHLSLADSENIEKANNPWGASDSRLKLRVWTGKSIPGKRAGAPEVVHRVAADGVCGRGGAGGVDAIETWKDYLRYHLIEQYGADLPGKFADESFEFFQKTLQGAQAQRPREQRGIRVVNMVLGDAVGKIYAEQYFSAEEKAKVQALVANLIATFRQRLEANTWLAASTKAEAIAKLGTLQVGIGYPESWRSYAGLEIRRDDLIGNLMRAGLFDYHYQVGRIGKPVDRKEWCMGPQTVNAVNLPLDNGLNFPAAILQPPFYDPQAPMRLTMGRSER